MEPNYLEKIKIGFIGFGQFAKLRETYLKQINEVEIVGFFDTNAIVSGDIPKQYNKLTELIDNVDAIFISVPPYYAPKYVSLCLRQNKSVFCEKPAAVSLHELSQVEQILNKTKAILAYGFNHRQHESIHKIKSIIDDGTLGKILWMRGRYGKEVTSDYINTWRCDKKLNGGGILIDQGIHMIDLMSYLADGFDGAQAVLSNNYLHQEGVEDNAFINLYSTKTKITASVHSTITQWRYLFSLEIFLEEGSMILNGLRTKSGRYGDEILTIKPRTESHPAIEALETKFDTNTSWQKEVNEFISAVRSKRQYGYAQYRDAEKTTKLIDLIYKRSIWL